MKHPRSWKQLAHLLISFTLLFGLLLPTTAFAEDKGKPQPAASSSKQDDKKDPPKPASSSQSSKQDDKKSGDLPGGTMGKSGSNPDGQGVDKPYDAAGQKANSQRNTSDTGNYLDGNNGCGQDKKYDEARESETRHTGYDDNNGWCGKKPENVKSNDDKPKNDNDKPVSCDKNDDRNDDKCKNDNPSKNDDKPVNNSCDKNDDRNDDKCKKDEGVHGTTEVTVKGCFEWKDSEKRFYIDTTMKEDDAKEFKASTHFISDNKEGCKTPEEVKGTVDVKEHGKVYICHRTGSMTNPWVLIHVSVNAQGHVDHDKFDIHAEDKFLGETLPPGFTEASCASPNVLGTTDDTPNPPATTNPPTGNPPADNPPTTNTSVRMYGCFRDANGNYRHYNQEFASEADKAAFESSNGLTVIASMPNPEDCKPPTQQNNIQNPPSDNPQPQGPPSDNPQGPPSDNPQGPPSGTPQGPTEVAGIQTEPGPTLVISIATVERDQIPSLVVPSLSIDRFITTAEVREEMPDLDIPAAPGGVLALIDESPAPAAPQAITPQAPRPTTGLLPVTGEPLVNLALISLGFLALTLVGLRLFRAGTRRA